MRRFIFLTLFFGAFLLGPVAQAAHGQFGMQAGINIASSSSSTLVGPAITSTSEAKFMGGVFFESSGDVLRLQPEFTYIDKGSIQYLMIPLLFKIKLALDPVRPFFVVGPEGSFKIGGGTGIKTFDIAAQFGAGLEFALNRSVTLHATGRYSLGLVSVSDTTTTDLKTRGIHLMAGIGFAL